MVTLSRFNNSTCNDLGLIEGHSSTASFFKLNVSAVARFLLTSASRSLTVIAELLVLVLVENHLTFARMLHWTLSRAI